MPAEEMKGVNTQAELAEASAALRDRIAMGWMERGVMMLDPSSVWIGPDVNTCIYRSVERVFICGNIKYQ